MSSSAKRQTAEHDLHQTLIQGHGQKIVGAGLRLLGPPGSIDVTSWNFVRDYYPQDLVVTVGAATRLSQISQVLAEQRQWLPLGTIDHGDDTIGGAIASGVEGWYCGGYGSLRDRILGMRIVTPAFGPIFVGSHVVKNVAGYNLSRIFAGTRGALGVITEVTLKVSPQPRLEVWWSQSVNAHNLSSELQRWHDLAPAWASLSVIQVQGMCTLYAVWHGRPAGLERLAGIAGTPQTLALPALPISQDDLLVSGSVLRTEIANLLSHWPNTGMVHVETQCGRFFGSVSTAAQWNALHDWVYAASGSIRLLRDRHRVVAPRPWEDPLWQAMKTQYDPDHCLMNPE